MGGYVDVILFLFANPTLQTPGPTFYRTMPSNRFLNHLIVSVWLILCDAPILDLHRRRLATRSPGRVLLNHQQRGSPSLLLRAMISLHAAIEVHSVDTNTWVIFDPKIDVFADPKPEVSCLGEISLL